MSIRTSRIATALFAAGLSAAPVLAHAATPEKPCETQSCQTVRDYWKSVKTDTSDAAHWTAKEGHKGWEATRNGATDAARWTGKESRKGWRATKHGVKNVAHDVRDMGSDQPSPSQTKPDGQ